MSLRAEGNADFEYDSCGVTLKHGRGPESLRMACPGGNITSSGWTPMCREGYAGTEGNGRVMGIWVLLFFGGIIVFGLLGLV